MKLGLQKVAEMNTFEYNKSKEIEFGILPDNILDI
jgi:hypothetical protein